jgi:UDP-N-acetylglucosamine 2-epimerase (non-hydrolysing)
MKVLTVIGTRPEIIRLSRIIPKLDKACDHYLLHTGQSYDDNMSAVFFRELGLRKPDYLCENHCVSLGAWLGTTFQSTELAIKEFNPDRVLILGDTNSALTTIIAKRLRVPVYHLEAGNRCFDDRGPEEINRRVIDQCSDILLPYTERSRANLIREGYPSSRIFVVGNPIYEVIKDIQDTDVLLHLGIMKNQKYFLVTAHRQENVEDRERLIKIIKTCSELAEEYEASIIFSTHPRTSKNIEQWKIDPGSISFCSPFGLNDFVTLERHALCVLSDSGTVCEETSVLKVRCVTLRDVTERPETLECGANILSGVEPESIKRCVKTVLSQGVDWTPPAEYTRLNVSDTVVKIMTGY